jgi:hypothetical protein
LEDSKKSVLGIAAGDSSREEEEEEGEEEGAEESGITINVQPRPWAPGRQKRYSMIDCRDYWLSPSVGQQ